MDDLHIPWWKGQGEGEGETLGAFRLKGSGYFPGMSTVQNQEKKTKNPPTHAEQTLAQTSMNQEKKTENPPTQSRH